MTKEIDELVRDLTKVGSIPKSEARQRITSLLLNQLDGVMEEVENRKKKHNSTDMASKYFWEKEGFNCAIEDILIYLSLQRELLTKER